MINLLQNGIDALTANRQTVSLATGCNDDGTALFLEVCDEGAGIPEESLAH